MKSKKTRTVLLILGTLLLALALFAGAWLRLKPVVSSSVQQTAAKSAEQNGTSLETVADEEIPLAGVGESPSEDAVLPAAESVPATVHINTVSVPVGQSAGQEPAEEPSDEQPAEEAPTEQPADEESAEEPTDEESAEEPADEEPATATTAAQRLYERAAALLEQYNACTTMEEKRVLLGASNYSLGNDAIRKKLLADMEGSWEQLEEETVDATEYQQDKTLYVQVYMAGTSDDYQPVIYTTQNSDLSGNQWSTNLVYIEDTETWMEYVKKHPYNDSCVGYYMTSLYNDADAWDELQEDMETDGLWTEVDTQDESSGAEEAPSSEYVSGEDYAPVE
ncbi:MAG TPA: hypothetical protein P5075_09220 [Eubacteriales bacterium]|nr:hypothetical protein [Eubacteriales bacterium]